MQIAKLIRGPVLALVWLAASAGCGGGGSGGAGFMTSVPAGTKLTALTPSQQTQLCNDVQTYFQRTLAGSLCKTDGVLAAGELLYLQSPAPTDAQLRTACTQAYDSCLSPDGGITMSSSCNVGSEPATCQATVGDVQTCLNDTSAAYQRSSAALPSCDSLTAASLQAFLATASSDGGSSSTEPLSCSKFDSTCGSMM